MSAAERTVALALDERGQMTVELAVMAPVVIVIALVVLTLRGFVEACAAFDQAAPDAVLAHGVAPAGEQTREAAEREVRSALERALGREGRCEVEVRCEGVLDSGAEGAALTILAFRTVLLVVFVAYAVKKDVPLAELPFVGKYFKR